MQRLVESGRALATLGNHEINLLRGDRKDGNDWFWSEFNARDAKYEPRAHLPPERRDDVIAFLRTLPLALERADLRVVHAAWDAASIALLRAADPALSRVEHFRRWDADAEGLIAVRGIGAAARLEYAGVPRAPRRSRPRPCRCWWPRRRSTRSARWPIRSASSPRASNAAPRGRSSPAGTGASSSASAGGTSTPKTVPVVVGHYWRQFAHVDRASLGKAEENLFTDLAPTAWHGLRRNVFCIDFSVGGRFLERPLAPGSVPRSRLGALRWPERVLALDTGEMLATSAA